MQNNLKQVKNDGLPVVSENEQVQKNSMRLYVYLISISTFQGKDRPRTFTQRDFTINKIHTLLEMHAKTVQKYWKLLEDNGLIKYEGPSSRAETQTEWDKAFMERKKNKTSFYTIPKTPHGYIYRIMPRETLEKIQNEFAVSELELKLYLLLANMQEHFCYMSSPERIFNLSDLRELLKLSKKVENNKAILMGLLWLEKLNLIEYKVFYEENNLGEQCACFNLIAVNYYTDGGEIARHLNSKDGKLSNEIKAKILEENLVKEVL